MKCPLLAAGTASPGYYASLEELECLKGECAWWDGRFSQCVMLTGAEALYNLRNDISKELSHDKRD